MHQVVVAQLAAARQGTHKTKTRGEVSGGGAKPYKQKGTGRARQGSTRAPQFTGGGVVHGPVPRDYSQRTPKKMKAAALRGALSDRARNGRVHVLESLVAGDAPSTRLAATTLATIASSRHVLVVVPRTDELAWKSIRNIPTVHVDLRRTSSTRTTCWSATTSCSPRRRWRPSWPARRRARPPPRPPAPARSRRVRTVSDVFKDHRDVLLAPVISEKSYGLLDQNKYTFVVAPDANKTEIKIAVEKVFNVKVESVNTLNRQGKRKRTRQGYGKRKDTKRAVVSLAAGDRIEIFGGPVA